MSGEYYCHRCKKWVSILRMEVLRTKDSKKCAICQRVLWEAMAEDKRDGPLPDKVERDLRKSVE